MDTAAEVSYRPQQVVGFLWFCPGEFPRFGISAQPLKNGVGDSSPYKYIDWKITGM